MNNLIGNSLAALTLQLVAFSATEPRAHYTVINDLHQKLLDNTLIANRRVDELQGQLQNALNTNTLQSQQITTLFGYINTLESQIAALSNRVNTLETSGGGAGGGTTTPSVVTVDFTYAVNGAVANGMTFDGNANTTQGNIVAYEWSFGDGTTGTGETVAHSYPGPGNYNVTLLARDGTGRTNSVTKQITVLQTQFAMQEQRSYEKDPGKAEVYGAWTGVAYPSSISYSRRDPELGGGISERRKYYRVTPPVTGRTIASARLHVNATAGYEVFGANAGGGGYHTIPLASITPGNVFEFGIGMASDGGSNEFYADGYVNNVTLEITWA